MKSILFIVRRCALTALIALTLMVLLGTPARAQTSTFTYQGRLTDGMAAASGAFDFEFALYDTGGNQIGEANTRDDVQVMNGVFTVQLDFGAAAFDGAPRTLGISVRRGMETGAFTTLTPRQPITSTPYAIRAVSTDTAASATNAQQLGGTAASQFVQTEDARLSDARQPAAGSSNYIQNQNSAAQTSANFNIEGTGAANIFDATTAYNIGGNPVLRIAGSNNLFAGVGAGAANTTGGSNSFVGRSAGAANTTGGGNSFVGVQAGQNNTDGASNSFFGGFAGLNTTTGGSNSFVGSQTGQNNTTGNDNSFFGAVAGAANTTGSSNSFFGRRAGINNLTGSNNTAIGQNANVGSGALTYATAIGSGALVSDSNSVVLGRPADAVQIPGTLVVTGAISGTTTNATQLGGVAANQYLTTAAANTNFIQNTTTQQTSSNFSIDGTGAANIFNAGLQYNIGGTRAFTITANNTIAGFGAGETATGTNNSFYGYLTGRATFGSANSFFGFSSGAATLSGGSNSFFGENSGLRNTSGRQNSFFGRGAGQTNVDGNNNTALGMNADVGTGALRFAAAIGSYSLVSTNDTIVLGKAAGMFNGVQRPADAVQIPGSLVVSGNGTMGSLTVNGSGTGTTRIGGVFNSANYAGISLNNSTDPNHYNFLSSPNDQSLYINRPSGNSIIFRKDNQTQMTLDTDGNLTVSGSISGATKNFKIDHPLDPANKTLTYTSIESPDMKNIYDGNITTNAKGEATVTMPDYFSALNKDFRYQLTVIGRFAQAIISDEINGNQFKIKTDKPNVKVSWQVTGIRRDPFAEDQRQPIEQEKPAASKGKCLYAPACQNKLEKK